MCSSSPWHGASENEAGYAVWLFDQPSVILSNFFISVISTEWAKSMSLYDLRHCASAMPSDVLVAPHPPCRLAALLPSGLVFPARMARHQLAQSRSFMC